MQLKLQSVGFLTSLIFAAASLALPQNALAADDKPISIAVQYGYAYLPVIVAEQKGYFAEQLKAKGFSGKVEIKKISGAPAINDALISGTVDIGAYGLSGMLIAAEKTKSTINIRGVAVLLNGDNGFYTNRADLKSLKDLNSNDRIAVTSTTGQQGLLLRMAAKKEYDDARRFDTLMVQLPHPDATSALLAGGSITGYVANHPYSDIVGADPKIHKLFDFSDYFGQRATSAILATTGKFMKNREGAGEAIFTGLKEADDFIRNNPKEAAAIFLASEKSPLSPDQIEKMLISVKDEWSSVPSGVIAFADFMAENGLLKNKLQKWQDVFFEPVASGTGN
ncbi:ABC transporter substrate-binding protein [Rhizobium sp. NFACC06-2]|uniref:ABC transporter substrate-binding protein n=1 Tax=Rhizobium sp. NFACC06-2 TaxID=1566264 RepID=UPI0008770ECA|nr:ABC transporter substrate-binding protein [Rhizobium sp. NFACC06-2]SCY74626.1 NitT/TauT family transport system substrate-binding protein [Rhizobium sp. NFACC06-2]